MPFIASSSFSTISSLQLCFFERGHEKLCISACAQAYSITIIGNAQSDEPECTSLLALAFCRSFFMHVFSKDAYQHDRNLLTESQMRSWPVLSGGLAVWCQR